MICRCFHIEKKQSSKRKSVPIVILWIVNADVYIYMYDLDACFNTCEVVRNTVTKNNKYTQEIIQSLPILVSQNYTSIFSARITSYI